MKICVFLGAVVLAFTGCGYKPLLTTDKNAHRHVFIETVENRTATSDVTATLLQALRSQLNQFGFRIEPQVSPFSDILTVRVFSIQSGTDSLTVKNGSERPVRRKWQIRAMVTLQAHNGTQAFGPEMVTAEENTDVSQTLSATTVIDTLATQHLVENLARRIALRVAESGDGAE